MIPLISFVVPVYNVEQYLVKCLKSLVNQTFTDIEIVLVDDGSRDKCPALCDEYARKDSRIKVIHKANGGLSDARNTGLRKASGEYIIFVDSDDEIQLDTAECFVKAKGNNTPDIIVGNARKIEGTKLTYLQHKYNTYGRMVDGKQYLKKELGAGTMYMAAWLNMYNREFLLSNSLEFRVGLLHEDEEFTPRAFLKAKKVIGTDILFYNYISREGSITRKANLTKNAVHIIHTCFELEEMYRQLEDEELRTLLNDNLAAKYLYAFQLGALYTSEYRSLIDRRFLSGLANTKRNRMKVFLFGFNKRLYYAVNYILKHINAGIS